MHLPDFEGRVAIVTGTTGIGKAVAKRLARGGARVLCCGINPVANDELAHEAAAENLGIQVRQVDVSQPTEVSAAVSSAVSLFSGLNVIVNAAAIHPFGSAVETSIETWNTCLQTNVTSIFLFAHFAIPELKKGGNSAIVNISSVQGHACQPGVAAYVTSKGAIHSLTRALAIDHAKDGVRVNSISPGSIRTPMLEYAAHKFSPDLPLEQVLDRFGEAHPMGRVGTAEEVAELAAFLASDRASFCTGGDYLIDGGLSAGLAVR
jgi:NAD(P)-dependent dehydrogenase (short-subunit alcohol dehydrogenase family)